MTDAKDELKAWSGDVQAVVDALGLERAREKNKYNCPACGSSNNLSLTTPEGHLRAHCFGNCGASGDIFNLVAAVEALSVDRDFPEVVKRTAELAGRLDLLDHPRRPRHLHSVKRAAPPPPVYAPEDEVRALWSAGIAPTEAKPAADYLAGRGFDVGKIAALDLLRVLPGDAPEFPWACFGASWVSTGYRMVMPVYDDAGVMRGLRAWTTTPGERRPKRVAPKGVSTKGLVLANAAALATLQGKPARRFVVTEGEPDMLAATTAATDGIAVFGVEAGAWSDAIAARVPDGAYVAVWTHHDQTGARYADEVVASLTARCNVVRSKRQESPEAA